MAVIIQVNPNSEDYIDFILDDSAPDANTLSALKRVCTVHLDPDDADGVIIFFNIYSYPAHAAPPLVHEELLIQENKGKKLLKLRIKYTDVSSPAVGSAVALMLQVNLILGNNASAQLFIDVLPAATDYTSLSGLINGVNTQFITSQGFYLPGKLKLWFNGQLTHPGMRLTLTDFSTGKFDVAPAPKAGNTLMAEYPIN